VPEKRIKPVIRIAASDIIICSPFVLDNFV